MLKEQKSVLTVESPDWSRERLWDQPSFLLGVLDPTLTKSKLPKQYCRLGYKIVDKQAALVYESTLKPDLVFAFDTQYGITFEDIFLVLEAKKESGEDVYLTHVGQLADYALALHECQPTRTYVPVLFLNGPMVEDAGPALDDDQDSSDEQESSDDEESNIVDVGDLLNCTVQITGRCTYLYEAMYKGKRAVLKFLSTWTNRLPEGAVYEVLNNYKVLRADGGEKGVPNLPQIFLSGNLVEDFDSFRLEFLVMEHCGTPIVEHIRGMRESKDDNVCSQAAAQAELYVKQVTSMLMMALAAGFLHWDISPGNIAIKDCKAFVIDWGYAKLLREPSDKQFAMKIAEHWSFNWNVVLAMEIAKDPFTGTPMYMSMWLLLKAETRGIYDELESLLYVILDTFSDHIRASSRKKKSSKPTARPPGFTFYSSEVTVLMRLSCMQSSKCFLGKFGVVANSTVAPMRMLDAMRRFLFFDDGNHLGGRILERKDFPHLFDHTTALGFMGEETVSDLLCLVGRERNRSPLTAETAPTTTSMQISTHDSKPASLPTPPYSIHSAEQGTLSDDVDIRIENIAARSFNSDVVPGRLSSTRSGSSSTCNVPNFIRQSESSTSMRFPRAAIAIDTAQAGPSRAPTCHTSFCTSAISRNNSSINASNDNRPDEWQVQTRSRSNTLANQSRSLTKENVKAVGKTKSKRSNPSKGANKRVGDNKSPIDSQIPAKRCKH
ncbi:hypothetical protein H4R27_005540 [Coemansia aciculifera]|nr:hypothetical protein H4R27_005540 [Coemansia aciculifera]